MRRIRTLVARSDGKAEFVPIDELWAVSGILADTFPLDRELARGPRWVRRAGHWTRLILVDRALTDHDRSALLTLTDTPWVPAVLVALLAAAVAPRLPRWLRLALLATTAVWIVRGRRGSRFLTLQHELRRVAPGALVVSDFVALQPGAGVGLIADVLDRIGDGGPFVALLPASGDERRDAARERLYVRRLGFRRVSETIAGGQGITVLVRS
jgi:hypothetical protein